MRDHHALRFAGGAGGVENVGEVGFHARSRRCHRAVEHSGPLHDLLRAARRRHRVRRGHLVHQDDRFEFTGGGGERGLQQRESIAQRHQVPDPAVPRHVPHALRRRGRVDRHIHAARLEDAEDRHDRRDRLREEEPHTVTAPDSERHQRGRELSGAGVELRVREASVTVPHGIGARMSRRARGEQLLELESHEVDISVSVGVSEPDRARDDLVLDLRGSRIDP